MNTNRSETLNSAVSDSKRFTLTFRVAYCAKHFSLTLFLCVFSYTAAASAQEALWKTYLEAGTIAYDDAQKSGETEKKEDQQKQQERYAEAEKRFELARKEAEAFGPQDPRLATTVLWLAAAYMKAENFAEGESLAKQFELLLKAGGNSLLVGMGRPSVNVADSYYLQKKLDEAERFYKLSLTILEKSPATTPDRKVIPEAHYGLGNIYYRQRRFAEAETELTAALKATDQYSTEDALVGKIYRRRAQNYEGQKKYGDAEKDYKRSMESFYSKLQVLLYFDAADDLSDMYQARGDWPQVEELLKPIITMLEKVNDPLKTLSKYSLDLGFAYQVQGKYEEALKSYGAAQAIYERDLKPDDPQQARVRNNIAKVYYQQHKYAEAERLYQQAIDIVRKGNPESEILAWYEKNYALLLYARGDKERAEPLFQSAVAIISKDQEIGQSHLASSWFELAEVYQAQEKYSEAAPLFKRAMDMRVKFMEPDHLDLAVTMEKYAATLRKLGRRDEAKTLEEQARVIRSKHAPQK